MTAKHLEAELVPYIRGDLRGEERSRAESHLTECAACRDDLESTREVLRLLRAEATEPPEIDWRRYRAELRTKLAERDRRRWSFALPRLVPLGATIAIGVLALVVTLRGGIFRSSPGDDLPVFEQTAIGNHLDLLRDYRVVENLDLFEDFEIVQDLDALAPVEKG